MFEKDTIKDFLDNKKIRNAVTDIFKISQKYNLNATEFNNATLQASTDLILALFDTNDAEKILNDVEKDIKDISKGIMNSNNNKTTFISKAIALNAISLNIMMVGFELLENNIKKREKENE